MNSYAYGGAKTDNRAKTYESPTIPAAEEMEPTMKSRTLVTSCRHPKAPTTPDGRLITTPRYAAALAAVAAAWERRPSVFTPERELFEMGELKAARAEVRAAWIETAALFGITHDQT